MARHVKTNMKNLFFSSFSTLSIYYMYINQQDAQNSVIILYFLLDALHVSDYISPSSGTTFYKLYLAFGIGVYQMRCTAYESCS